MIEFFVRGARPSWRGRFLDTGHGRRILRENGIELAPLRVLRALEEFDRRLDRDFARAVPPTQAVPAAAACPPGDFFAIRFAREKGC